MPQFLDKHHGDIPNDMSTSLSIQWLACTLLFVDTHLCWVQIAFSRHQYNRLHWQINLIHPSTLVNLQAQIWLSPLMNNWDKQLYLHHPVNHQYWWQIYHHMDMGIETTGWQDQMWNLLSLFHRRSFPYFVWLCINWSCVANPLNHISWCVNPRITHLHEMRFIIAYLKKKLKILSGLGLNPKEMET